MNKFYSILFFLLSNFCWSQKNVITEIEFSGIKRCNVTFLHKLLSVKKGNTLDTLLIKKDIKKLQNLVAIAKANYLLEEINGNYKLTYQLEENLTIIPQLNVWTVNNKLSYNIGLFEYNLFGRNIKLGGFYQNLSYLSF